MLREWAYAVAYPSSRRAAAGHCARGCVSITAATGPTRVWGIVPPSARLPRVVQCTTWLETTASGVSLKCLDTSRAGQSRLPALCSSVEYCRYAPSPRLVSLAPRAGKSVKSSRGHTTSACFALLSRISGPPAPVAFAGASVGVPYDRWAGLWPRHGRLTRRSRARRLPSGAPVRWRPGSPRRSRLARARADASRRLSPR